MSSPAPCGAAAALEHAVLAGDIRVLLYASDQMPAEIRFDVYEVYRSAFY